MKQLRIRLVFLLSLIVSSGIYACGCGCAKQSVEPKEWQGDQYQYHSRSQTVDARSLIQSLPSTNIKTIIDLGCGSGNSMQVLREKFPAAYIVGVDPEPTMLDKARQQFTNDHQVGFFKGDALSFRTSKPADLLYAGFVMHWIPRSEQLKALDNISLNLNKGGKIAFIFSPSKEGLPFQKGLNRLVQQQPYAKELKDFKQTQTFYKVDEYKEMLEKAGFFVEHIGYSYNEKRYKDSDELRLWIQQWLPYPKHLARKSIELRDRFMKQLVQEFINESGQQKQKELVWGEYVLTVVAHKNKRKP